MSHVLGRIVGDGMYLIFMGAVTLVATLDIVSYEFAIMEILFLLSTYYILNRNKKW